jgi:hypothetical protein
MKEKRPCKIAREPQGEREPEEEWCRDSGNSQTYAKTGATEMLTHRLSQGEKRWTELSK